MLISNLSEELQAIVRQRQIEQGNDGTFKGNLESGHLVNNFNWSNSKEGYQYWLDIDSGKIPKEYKKKKQIKQQIYEIY